jgi:hypothetical protein
MNTLWKASGITFNCGFFMGWLSFSEEKLSLC